MPKIQLDLSPFSESEKILRTTDPKAAARVDEPYTENIHARPDVRDAAESAEFVVSGSAIREGLMSASNGLLDSFNLHSGTEIRDIHVMPEQASYARMESYTDSSTLYGNGMGQRNMGEKNERFVTLPGVTIRWFQPFDTTVSLMHWDLFFSYNNWQGEYVDKEARFSNNGRKTKMDLQCILDGEYIPFTKRRISENMFHPVSPGFKNTVPEIPGPGRNLYSTYPEGLENKQGGGPKYCFSEAHSAAPLSLHFAQALTKGFHEISVQVKTVNIGGEAVYVQNIGSEHRTSQVRGRGFFELCAKLSLGIRNARVISLL
tara:strand:- start:1304 stop:2254 length:951 start_codon:yes stop_codon:yes gene_type:complete